MNKNYFIYCLLDSTKPGKYYYDELDCCFLYEPFYVGKGTKNRIKAHFYPSSLKAKNFKNNKIKSIQNKNMDIYNCVIKDNLNEEDAYVKESMTIIKMGRRNNNTGILTNLNDGGRGSTNCIIEKTRKKVYKYNLDKKLICDYDSITIASEDNNLHISDISKCCHGLANTHGGFFWSFSKKNNDFIINKNFVKIYHYDLSGNLLNIYPSIVKASIELNINKSSIIKCASIDGVNKVNKKHYFRYEHNKDVKLIKNKKYLKAVLMLNNKHDIIKEFKSVKETSECLNIVIQTVIRKCKRKTYNNYYLIYKDDYLKGLFKTKYKKKNYGFRIAKKNKNGIIVKIYDSILQTSKYEKIGRKKLTNNLNKDINGFIYTKIN